MYSVGAPFTSIPNYEFWQSLFSSFHVLDKQSDANKTATSSSHQDSEYDTASDSQSSDEADPLKDPGETVESGECHEEIPIAEENQILPQKLNDDEDDADYDEDGDYDDDEDDDELTDDEDGK